MNNPSTLKRQGVFRLMALPAELRRRVYYFAIVEPHPLPLITYRFYRFDRIAYRYSVDKDLRMLETCKEFRKDMGDLLYSENSFTYAMPRLEAEEDTKLTKIDIKRVQKCYIPIEDMNEMSDDSDSEESFFPMVEDEGLLKDFWHFMTVLAFKSHEMKYLLIECEPQHCMHLADGLTSFFLLRNIRLVHFRSRQTAMHRFFRFLEDYMMSDRPVPFSSMNALGKNDVGDTDLLDCPEKSWLVENLDSVASVVAKPQEQLELTAQKLYSILGVEGDFIPQSEME